MDFKYNSFEKFKDWKILCGFLVFLIFLNLFLVNHCVLKGSSKSSQARQSAPLFKTYKTSGNCYYQKNESQKWLFLSGEEILNSGSQIRTDDNSHAVFSFLNQNGRIETSGKSHVILTKEKKGMMVDFKKGEVFINYQTMDLNQPLYIKIAEKYFKLTNADIYLWGDAEGQVLLTVDYGKVHMTAGEHTNSFENGQMVHFKNDREYIVEESPFKISTPINYDRFNVEGNELTVRFAYAPLENDYAVQLYLGEDVYSLKPQFSKPLAFSKNEFSIKLPKGDYYWRVVAYDAKTQKIAFRSHIKRFFLESQIPIQPLSPVQNAQIPIVDGKAAVKFEWDNPSQLEKTFLEISDKKDFSNVIAHEVAWHSSYLTHSFGSEGDYFWRVSGFPFGTSEVLNGIARKIKIINKDVPRKIDILFPKNSVELTSQSLNASDIQFEWMDGLSIQKFKIAIQKIGADDNYEYFSESNSIKITDLPPGSYRWKVEDSRRPDISSDYENFRVLDTERITVVDENEYGFLSWEKGPRGTSQYRVEVLRIGSRSNFNDFFLKNAGEKHSKKTSTHIKGEKISYKKFSEGVYVFKIYAVNDKNKILADSQLKFLRVSSSLK